MMGGEGSLEPSRLLKKERKHRNGKQQKQNERKDL